METSEKTAITVQTVVDAPIEKVWDFWTNTQHITQWTFASDDWHAPFAENDLTEGGKFTTTMAAKDGSMSFDFGGIYTRIKEHKVIEYTMSDGRKVQVTFESKGEQTEVTETFDPENTNPVEMQQAGWQAILDNFKRFAESK